MRLNVLFIFVFIIVSHGELLAQRTCGSELNLEAIQKNDPERYQRIMQLEQQVAKFSMQKGMGMRSSHVVTIPVVVHVLHTGQAVGTGLNISMAQIQSQIDVLNEDFRRLNADATNTPAEFQGVAADSEIEFVLACVDPNGNPTNGIVRVHTTTNTFFRVPDSTDPNLTDEAATGIKFAPTGSPAWSSDRYLNIWVCNLGGGLLGYAQFPDMMATQPETDGIVVLTTAFGKTGNVSAPFDKGRTATHEIGHWLNLFHVFGEGGCGNDDFVADTPTQNAPHFECPSFPQTSCGSNDMFMNYMDFVDDDCMNLFTQGQVDRMWSLFDSEGIRESFVTCDLVAQVCSLTPTITGSPLVCTSEDFVLDNPPSGITVEWSSSNPSGLSIDPETGTATRQNYFNGEVTITATINSGCGSVDIEKTVWVGLTSSVSFTANYNQSQGIMLSTPYVGGGATAQWSVNSVPHAGFDISVQPLCIDYTTIPVEISLTVANQCDSITVCRDYVLKCPPSPLLTYVGTCGSGGGGEEPEFHEESQYSVSPNPASRLVNVAVVPVSVSIKTNVSPSGKTKNTVTIQSIVLTDMNGQEKYSSEFLNEPEKVQIDVSHLMKGVYILKVSNGNYIESHRIVVE
ncbi:MAG: T9SS type A sorting domain-containing protein [Cyclobacteriaceae bacterium]|nr:T9SS type A sorting domain-containing protein [Cyclobacteriaceae bacterium]